MWANRFLDPLYGPVRLDEFEAQLIRTPEAQRLRYIRMCNINSMLVTGASEISRFEHSLGTLHLANVWLHHHRIPADATQGRALRTAALLHDMQSGPFGHSFQYVLEDNDEGEFLHHDVAHGQASAYYQELRANASFLGRHFSAHIVAGEAWPQALRIIRGEGLLGPIVSGAIDLDNIDNVIRLAFHMGICDSEPGALAEKLACSLHLSSSGRPYISSDSIPLIEEWLDIRGRLYKFLLLDWAEFSAKAMLTYATEEAISYRLIGRDSWLLTDDELLGVLSAAKGAEQSIADTTFRLRCGDLWIPILLSETRRTDLYPTMSSIEIKRSIEDGIKTLIKGRTGEKVIPYVHFILDRGKTQRALNFFVEEEGKELTIGESSDRMLVGVFLSRIPQNKNEAPFKVCAEDILRSYGLTDLAEFPDPIITNDVRKECQQLKLF